METADISIEDFDGYKEDDFLEYLKTQETDSFEIDIPKPSELFNTTNNDIALDYLLAAYVGQELSKISSKFEYYYIEPAEPGSFVFSITTNKLSELAQLLFKVSIMANGQREDDDELVSFDCWSDVHGFADDIDTIKPACPEFVRDYKEYFTPEDEDEE
ncbi:MAG TPA: hypothetical protein VK154_15245 [Chitinophagales bacterium]|nr:hypothetical protein [Chitinophagales bacterium]